MLSNTSTIRQIPRAINCTRGALLIPVLLLQWACYDPNAHTSAIVREVEQAGAGDISSVTSEELLRWFANQPDPFVQKINGECNPLRSKAPAAWHMRTAEGRVCDAVAKIAPLTFTPYGADHTRY
jgi:hypothetical protein